MPNTSDVGGPFLWQHYLPPPPPPPPPPPVPEPVVLREIKRIRDAIKPTIGSIDLPMSMMERLYGLVPIAMLQHEPDPRTHRGDYYYNTRFNRLYAKIKTEPVPTWRQIGE